MSDTTQTPQPSPSGEEKPRRRFLRHAALATVIAGVTAGIGITALAEGGGHWRWQRGGFLGERGHESLHPSHVVGARHGLRSARPGERQNHEEGDGVSRQASHDDLRQRTGVM